MAVCGLEGWVILSEHVVPAHYHFGVWRGFLDIGNSYETQAIFLKKDSVV